MDNQKSLVWWMVIVVMVLAIAAFAVYYYQKQPNYQESANYQVPTKPSGDNINKIEADLKVTDVSNLGSEVPVIDQTLTK